jgi:hypothetical protein
MNQTDLNLHKYVSYTTVYEQVSTDHYSATTVCGSPTLTLTCQLTRRVPVVIGFGSLPVTINLRKVLKIHQDHLSVRVQLKRVVYQPKHQSNIQAGIPRGAESPGERIGDGSRCRLEGPGGGVLRTVRSCPLNVDRYTPREH